MISCSQPGGGVPEPSEKLANRAGLSLAEVGEGYWVFQRKCLECHQAMVPDDMSQAQWHPIVEGMAGNAGLSAEEEAAVVNYLKAATL
ncbi:MAG: cytochrome c [Verrucomicrobiota bacterium JB023]|nr:cytochrome c [Verrucomicrobiota bacterium JB023]